MTKKKSKEKESEMMFERGATMEVDTKRLYASISESIALRKENRKLKMALRACGKIIADALI